MFDMNSMSFLPLTLQQAFQTWRVVDSMGNERNLHSNVSEEEACLLNAAVRQIKPSLSVEVGLAMGISTLAILGGIEANGSGQHVVCDPFQKEYQDTGIAMVQRAGLDRFWKFHRSYAEEIIPTLPPLQFAFIDASHLFDHTLVEFVLVDKKLVPGGIVGFHDLWMPSLQKLLRFILANRAYKVWHPDGFLPSLASSQKSHGLKAQMRNTISKSRLGKFVSQEFLFPWKEYSIPNLVFLQKLANDERDWHHFVYF